MEALALTLLESYRWPVGLLGLVGMGLIMGLLIPQVNKKFAKVMALPAAKLLVLPKKVYWGLTIGLLVWGIWLRWADLGDLALYGDEFRHVLAAMSFLHDGSYRYWDPIAQQVGDFPYIRSWAYTWQVAQAINWWGTSELALRIPSFVWGGLFLLLAMRLTYSWLGTRLVGLLFFSQLVFDQTLIWQSRTVRMYPMFFSLLLLVLLAIQWLWSAKHRKSRLIAGVSLVILLVISYHAHFLTALLLPALIMQTGYWVVVRRQSIQIHKTWWWIPLVVLSVGVGLILYWEGDNIQLAAPQIEYFLIVWKNFAIPWLAIPLVVMGLLSGLTADKNRQAINALWFFLAVAFFGVLVYVLGRYPAPRYIFPGVLAVYWFWAEGVDWLGRRLLIRYNSVSLAAVVIGGLVLLSGNKLAVPGFGISGPVTRPAIANGLPEPGLGYTDEYKYLYSYLRTNHADARLLAIHGPHQLWYGQGLQITTLATVTDDFSAEELRYFIEEKATTKAQIYMSTDEEFKQRLLTHLSAAAYDWILIQDNLQPDWLSDYLERDYQLFALPKIIRRSSQQQPVVLVFQHRTDEH
jgi:hypothetical protein